jgi:hypothetical protein
MSQALDGSRSPWSDVIRALPALLGNAAEAAADAETSLAVSRAAEAPHA